MILEKVVVFIGLLFSHFLNSSQLFDIGGIKPDFMIVFVLFFALRRGALFGLWVGFVAGLLTDGALGAETDTNGRVEYMVGIHSLAYSIIGYIVGKFTRNAYNENYFSITIYSLVTTLVSRIMIYFIFVTFFYSNKNFSFIGVSLYTAAISPLLFYAFTIIYRLEISNTSK